MNQQVIILIAEYDESHAELIRKNLAHAGIANEIIHFRDGQEIVIFLFSHGAGPHRKSGEVFILLLDIRMPKLGGNELEQIKADPELRKIPVIMITTANEPREVARFHRLGCNNYITKPVEYEPFVNVVRQLGLFLAIVQVPRINGND